MKIDVNLENILILINVSLFCIILISLFIVSDTSNFLGFDLKFNSITGKFTLSNEKERVNNLFNEELKNEENKLSEYFIKNNFTGWSLKSNFEIYKYKTNAH